MIFAGPPRTGKIMETQRQTSPFRGHLAKTLMATRAFIAEVVGEFQPPGV